MTDGYVFAEEYTLPSMGKVYDVKVNPVVRLKSMNTEHEMKRLSPSERPYKTLCEIIDDCLVDNPGISSYDMCMADYIFLLHKLRVATYGKTYDVTSVCPYCGSETKDAIDLDALEVKYYDKNNFAELTQFTLPRTGKQIKLVMQTPRMNDEIAIRSKELKRKSNGAVGDSALLYTLQMVVDTVDGKRMDVITSEDFLRNLPMMDTNYIIQHAQKLVESFGVRTEVNRVCSVCGLDYNSSFRLGPDFFRPEIDI